MDGSITDLGIYALAAVVVGMGVGWLIHSGVSRLRISQINDDWQNRFDDMTRQRDRLTAESSKLRLRVEEQEGVVNRHKVAVTKAQTELETVREREKRMAKDIFTLRGEREDFKNKVLTFQNAMTSVKQQTADMQAEFIISWMASASVHGNPPPP